MMKVGITGGIGSGKSTVCRLFALRGVAVYDSDSAARRLMSDDGALREAVAARFGNTIYRDGVLDRAGLAAVVFSDSRALADLNAVVHPAVRRDFETWAEAQTGDYVVLESAILFETGFDALVDRSVAVLAPAALRIERASKRDRCEPEAVRRRIEAQLDDDTLCARADFTLVNIFEADLAPAVAELDARFRLEAKQRHAD